MPDKPLSTDVKPSGETAPAAATPPVPPRRSPGHRGADVRDTVAEMAAKAQEISQEAGSKMAAAMKDVINAAAGIAGFAVESARDLVQYMVRRGQMTQEEADKLIREAEAAQVGRTPMPPRPAAPKAAAPSVAAAPVEAPPVRAPAPPVRAATPVATKAVAAPMPAKTVAAPAKAAAPARAAAPAARKASAPAKAPAKKPAPAAKKHATKAGGRSAPAKKASKSKKR
jgi:polyhydroxyalkanoate synthesis regulator phasin